MRSFRKSVRGLFRAGLAAAVLAQAGFGYYHFLHVRTVDGQSRLIPEKFDLNRMPGGAVQFLMTARSPEKLADGDSLTSIVSQLRAAGDVWNTIPASRLSLVFGGYATPGAEDAMPGIDVVFDELPPGLIAIAGPTVIDSTSGVSDFVPIQRSTLVLPKDMTAHKSFEDNFFLTLVHELGHALGLQHTQTSGVMSTYITRGTTRAFPLTADDRAGISALYPAAGAGSQFGEIQGTVRMRGKPVHLASVAAITAGGVAVSGVSRPDGSYTITGLPPGPYYLYAQSYPPAVQDGLGPGDVVLPALENGDPVPASGFFAARFYPSTISWQDAQLIPVEAGKRYTGFDFDVEPRTAMSVYDVTTYSFPARVAVHPGFININTEKPFMVASGYGLVANGKALPGLDVSVVGGAAFIPTASIIAYPWATAYLQTSFEFTIGPALGPKHLVFRRNGDPYVLPAGIHLVAQNAPKVDSIETVTLQNGTEALSVRGANFAADTRFYLDGLPARMLTPGEKTFPSAGPLLLIPPSGADRHRARLTAFNRDGQSSQFLQGTDIPAYEYPALLAPSLQPISPDGLAAGSERMVDIVADGARWSAETVVGFGSADVLVRRVWVLAPGHLMANVSVAPGAKTGPVTLTVSTGFESLVQPNALQILPADPRHIPVNPSPWNPETGFASLYPGGAAALALTAQPALGSEVPVEVTLNDQPVPGAKMENGAIRFRVPANLSTLVVFRMKAGDRTGGPLLLPLDPAPPVLAALTHSDDSPVDDAHPAQPKETLRLALSSVPGQGGSLTAGRFAVSIGGVPLKISAVSTPEDREGIVLVEVSMPETGFGESPAKLVLAFDGRPSPPVSVPVAVSAAKTP